MNVQQVKEFVWKSKLAVKIEMENIPPLYLKIYRQHYLIYYYSEIFKHIQTYSSISFNVKQMVLNYKNQVLPYQVPFGVLYDLLSDQCEQFTPISLVVQFLEDPQFRDLESEISDQYYFNLKQAILIKFKHLDGLNRLLQFMSSEELKKMFNSAISSQIETNEFMATYDRIFDLSKVQKMYLPIRIYSKKIKGRIQCSLELENEQETIIQALQRVVESKDFIFNGLPLENSPALYFYKDLQFIDGFCYFIAK